MQMRAKEWTEVFFLDLPEVGPITPEGIEDIKKNAHLYRGSVRFATGRVFADEEYEQRRQEILKKPLP